MVVHKKKCPIWNICHCLVVEETNFFQCCGHYHAGPYGCRGRVIDERKYMASDLKVHWDNHK